MEKAHRNMSQRNIEQDHSQYLIQLKEQLSQVLKVLLEQMEGMRENHRVQLDKLYAVIADKEIEIARLKTDREMEKQKQKPSLDYHNSNINKHGQSVTPYKILLKNNNQKQNNLVVNKQNTSKCSCNILDEVCEPTNIHININKLQQNRFSLQLLPSSGKKTSRVSSSIKNKIINRNADHVNNVLSPRPFLQEVSESNYANYLVQNQFSNIFQRNINEENKQSVRNYNKEQFTKFMGNCQNIQVREQSKISSKLCRKPSNRSKRQLLLRKKQPQCYTKAQTLRTRQVKYIDVTIPIKTITVPR